MYILKVIMPVLIMIGMGAIFRQTGFLTSQGIEDIKKLITKVVLPVAVFHALSTADYNLETAVLVGLDFAAIIATFLLGYLVRPLVGEPYRKYIPFMVSVYEGGMIAYPLYANLCGSEYLYNMAILDIACLLFGFSVYMGLLQLTENGTPANVRFLISDALKNPTFLAALAGIVCGLTGVVKMLMAGSLGDIYIDVEKLITTPLTAMILLVVGYNMKPEKTVLIPSVKTILLRVAVQVCVAVPFVFLVSRLMPGNTRMLTAIIIFMSAPPTFSMQSFLKTEEGSTYAATTNSLYCIVSILVYGIMAAIV